MKEDVRLGYGKEGAKGGLSLSYFHFTAYNLEYIQRDLQNSDTYSTRKRKKNADLPSHSSPQHSAFIHPIGANKPILSTLTVGFIPSTTQSASTKPNIHAGTGAQNYTYTLIQIREERAGKSFFFILK